MLLSLGGRAVREEKYLQNLSFFTERLPRRGQSFFSRVGAACPKWKKYFSNLLFFTERLPRRGQPFFSRLGRCPRKRNRRGMFSIFSLGKSLSQPTFRGDVAATDLRKTGP